MCRPIGCGLTRNRKKEYTGVGTRGGGGKGGMFPEAAEHVLEWGGGHRSKRALDI